MSRGTLGRRIDQVVTTRGVVAIDRAAERLARRFGLDPVELANEAKRLIIQCQHGGAVTWEDCLHVIAEQQGCTVEDLSAETAALLEGSSG